MQPIIIEGQLSIAAGEMVTNVIRAIPSLERYLRAPTSSPHWDGSLEALFSLPDVGYVTLDYGSKSVVDSSLLGEGSFLTYPYNMINPDWHCSGGDQLVLSCQNRDAVTDGVLFFRITLRPTEQRQTDSLVTQDMSAIPNDLDYVSLLAGRKYERLMVPGYLGIYLSAADDTLVRQVYIEQSNIAPESNIPATNRIPRDPDDFSIGGIEVPINQQQTIQVRQASAGAGDVLVFWRSSFKEAA
jgi:hypothetical protein